MKFNTEFELLYSGHLKPVIYAVELNWGETSFYTENQLMSMVLFQVIKYMQMIIKNSIYFLGDYLLSGFITPLFTDIMHGYMLPLHLGDAFKGQNAEADFLVDFRQVKTPFIGQGYMDLYAVGDL